MEWDKNITSLNIYCIVPLFQSIYPCPKYVLKLSVSKKVQNEPNETWWQKETSSLL